MMLLEIKRKRDAELCQYIKELASKSFNNEEIKRYAYKLKDLYTQDFRHSYSLFFPIITEIEKDKSSSVEYLTNNLEALKEIVEIDNLNDNKEFGQLSSPLLKLADHINLEIARYLNYVEKEEQTAHLEQKIENSTNQLNQLKENLKKATEDLGIASRKIKSVQGELIAVLSIFAAIVMTFSGGLNILNGVLAGANDLVLPERILFLLICGFILINFIFAMMYFVAKITERSIYARCETENCTCKNNKSPKCCGITRIRKRLPYVFGLNVAILILLGLDILWILHY